MSYNTGLCHIIQLMDIKLLGNVFDSSYIGKLKLKKCEMSCHRMRRLLFHSRCLATGLNIGDKITQEAYKHHISSDEVSLFPVLRNSNFKMGNWINLYLTEVTNESQECIKC